MIQNLIKTFRHIRSHLMLFLYSTPLSTEETLLPEDNIGEESVYIVKLKQAFRTNKLNNIAISGGYGAGKSSIIRSFFSYFPFYRKVEISLTYFEHDQKLYEGLTNGELEKHKHLESAIVQQMIYSQKPSALPDSRVERVNRLSRFSQWFFTLGMLVFLGSLGVLLKPDWTDVLLTNLKAQAYIKEEDLRFFASCSAIVGMVFILFKVARGLKNLRVTKLSNQSIEASSHKEQLSIKNNLDEILYFFEVTGVEVIVFEDIDRYDDIQLFSKLRDLNTLINNSKQVKHQVRFLYAIKDDIFKNAEDRTKFFDYILPVVAHMNQSTSGSELFKRMQLKFQGEGVAWLSKDQVSELKKLLDQIGIYLHDPRMVNNIIVEFEIYLKKLAEQDASRAVVDKVKLFAMIFYKNVCPQDFAKIHNGESNIQKILKQRDVLLKILTKRYEEEISELKANIKGIESITHRDHEALIDSVIAKVIFERGYNFSFNNFAQYRSKEGMIQFFKNFSPADEIVYYFNEQYQNITERNAVKVEQLHYKIHRLRTDIVNVSHRSWERLLSEEDVYQTFLDHLSKKEQFEELFGEFLKEKKEDNAIIDESFYCIDNLLKVNGLELLLVLIRRGYIDDTYDQYIGVYGEGILSQNDILFLRSLNGISVLPIDHPLTNIDGLLKRIQPFQKKSNAILNVHLIDDLWEESDIEPIFNNFRIKTNDSRAKDVIDFFFSAFEAKNYKWRVGSFFMNISKYYPEFLRNYSNDNQCAKAFAMVALYADHDGRSRQCHLSNSAKGWLQVCDDFIAYLKDYQIDETGKENFKSFLDEISLSFANLSLGSGHYQREITEHIISEGYYALNKHMITFILHFFENTEEDQEVGEDVVVDIDKYWKGNYGQIRACSSEVLKQRVSEHIDDYVKILLDEATNTQEPLEGLIELWAHEKLSLEKKQQLIQHCDFELESLEDVGDTSLWAHLIEVNGRVKCSWENVVVYFEKLIKPENVLDDPFWGYIDLCIDDLLTDYTKDNEDHKALFSYIVHKRPEVEIDTFRKVLKNWGYYTSTYNLNGISEKHLSLIIECGTLGYSLDLLEKIKEISTGDMTDNGHYLDYLWNARNKHDKKINVLLSSNFVNDIYPLLSEGDTHQLYLKMTEKSDKEKFITDIITEGMLKSDDKFCENVAEDLVSLFDKPLQIDHLFDQVLNTPINLRKELLIKYGDQLSTERLIAQVHSLGDDWQGVVEGRQVVVDDSDPNERLLHELEKLGIVSSKSKIEDGSIRAHMKRTFETR